MLDPRIYRAALVPLLLVAIVCAFSLEGRPAAIGTTLAPDAFDGDQAMARLERLARAYPDRRPGDVGDAQLARAVAGELRAISAQGFEIEAPTFRGETIDGERTLTTVIARQVGRPGPGLVVVAHRDAAGRGARAELSGTAAMLEIARVVADGRLRRTVTFVSTSGGSGGAAGAADLATRLGGGVEAILVLGDMAGRGVRKPFVVGWSNGREQAPLQLRRTVEAAVRAEAGTDPGGPRAPVQWTRLALPGTVGEQGPLLQAGLPAVLLSTGGERPPAAAAPVSERRMEVFGRAALRSLVALDEAPRLDTRAEDGVVTLRKVLPAWSVRLLVGTLLLAPILSAVDGYARLRRRRRGRHGPGDELSVAGGVAWIGSVACAFAGAAAFAGLLGWSGLLTATPPAPVLPSAVRLDGTARTALISVALVFLLGWMLVRPAVLHAAAGRRSRLAGDGAGIALLLCWCALAVAMWVVSPYAAALLVPAAHLLIPVVAPGVRLRRGLPVLLVALGLLPFLVAAAIEARQLGLDPAELAWFTLLTVAGGHATAAAWLFWSAVAACATAAFVLAARARPPEPAVPAAPVTVRGPLSYAGPGSLGGTESSLRR